MLEIDFPDEPWFEGRMTLAAFVWPAYVATFHVDYRTGELLT